ALIEEQKRAEEERTNRDTLRAIQRAFREAMIALPTEEYDWFDVAARRIGPNGGESAPADAPEGEGVVLPVGTEEEAGPGQRRFSGSAGPLHGGRMARAAGTVAVGASRGFRAIARDASRRPVEAGVEFAWRLAEGAGRLEGAAGEVATFVA